ncbi:MAG: hypothetical protein JEZ04_14250 [Spirochaetales bacterium]|nr:hypothetical protein [Spirochaetales bacterium]
MSNNAAELFGCANWTVSETEDEVTAVSDTCTLCAIAKKQGAPQPCRPFCINPFAAFSEELGYGLEVQKTLWESERCIFISKRK